MIYKTFYKDMCRHCVNGMAAACSNYFKINDISVIIIIRILFYNIYIHNFTYILHIKNEKKKK